MTRRLAAALPVAVGAAAGAASYTFGSSTPGLTAAVAASYAVTTALAVALFGVGPALPVAGEVRLSLRLLVLGLGFAMWVFGVAYARAKAE
jgi:hypothetical protein